MRRLLVLLPLLLALVGFGCQPTRRPATNRPASPVVVPFDVQAAYVDCQTYITESVDLEPVDWPTTYTGPVRAAGPVWELTEMTSPDLPTVWTCEVWVDPLEVAGAYTG